MERRWLIVTIFRNAGGVLSSRVFLIFTVKSYCLVLVDEIFYSLRLCGSVVRNQFPQSGMLAGGRFPKRFIDRRSNFQKI